ncbi:MAG: STAS domain-containing protein [Paludibacteraceae bacterium]|nr:STAS domain-containing protein [Paludibacteraceae bacterium]
MKVEIETGNSANAVVARLQGRLDTAAAVDVTPYFEQLAQYAAGHIIVDCEQLEYIASSGLRLLLGLRKEVAAKSGRLQIRSINSDIRQVFMMTGFISLFEIV